MQRGMNNTAAGRAENSQAEPTKIRSSYTFGGSLPLHLHHTTFGNILEHHMANYQCVPFAQTLTNSCNGRSSRGGVAAVWG